MTCQTVSAMGGSVGSTEAELVLNSLRRSGGRHVRPELSGFWSEAGYAGTVGAAAQAAAGLNACWRDHTCQTAIRTLRATADLAALALPCRARTST